jgi:hypothetical protein
VLLQVLYDAKRTERRRSRPVSALKGEEKPVAESFRGQRVSFQDVHEGGIQELL